MLLIVAAFILFSASRQMQKSITCAGLCSMLALQLITSGFQEVAPSRSAREISTAIQANHLSDVPVYAVEGNFPRSLSFYLGKIVWMVGFKGELTMGIDAEPHGWLATPEQFIKQWQAESQAIAVFKPAAFERYAERNLPMRIIYQGPGRIVVAKY